MVALKSNKEDTANAIEIIGEMQEVNETLTVQLNDAKNQFEFYKEYAEECLAKEKRSVIATNVIIPLTTIPIMVLGGILMASNNDFGKPVLYSGLGLFFGCEIIYNGGHWVFKLW